MKTLTTPIQLKNVTKIAVDKFVNQDDESPPYGVLSYHLQDNDGKVYLSGTLRVFDDEPTDTIFVRTTSLTIFDKIDSRSVVITGAYTALVTAAGALRGEAKRLALETTCNTLQIFGVGLAAT